MPEREQLSLKSLKAPWAELYPLGALEQRSPLPHHPTGLARSHPEEEK